MNKNIDDIIFYFVIFEFFNIIELIVVIFEEIDYIIIIFFVCILFLFVKGNGDVFIVMVFIIVGMILWMVIFFYVYFV